MSTSVHPNISVYGENARRGHNVAVRVDGVSVLLTSEGPDHDARCVDVAIALLDLDAAAEARQAEREQHEAEVAALRTRLGEIARERDAALRSLEGATRGQRRFNSAVLCVPHSKGEWDGAVWLLDPEKRESGFGLLFGSLAEVRKAHPELWIVRPDGDGVLLDARPLGGVA